MEQRHFDIVNHATPRLASMDKALGRGKYTDDLELPNMACAALVRCPYSHAKVLSIDVSEAEKVPGFLGCALPEEAPQAYFNCSGNPPSPLLMADEKVLTTEPLTIGDRVAVVADGVPADQKHRHRRRQHHAGPPLHLLQPPHLWRSGLAYCFKTGGSICHQIPNSPVCRAIYYSDVATALIAYEAEVEYIEDGKTHRTDLKSLIERHSVANGLACHEHLPILVTRFFVPAVEEGERSGFYKYAMRTTIDFPIINFALRCGGKRPARLAAGAVAPHPVVMAETAAKIDSDATDDEVIAQAEDELRKLAMPIKEACMTPAVKRSLYRHVAMLLDLRK